MMNLLRRLADNREPGSVAAEWRRKRFVLFESLVSSLAPPITILDVGGTEAFWERMGFAENRDAKVVLLNLEKVATANPNEFRKRGR